VSATIRDIAKYANTSIATVSRVLNDSPSVGEATKEKVKQAIIDLGYTPPKIAQALSGQNINTIGLLMPDINNMYYPAVIRGIEDEFLKNNYHILLCNTDEDIKKEKKYIHNLLTKGVEGIIFLGTRPINQDNSHIIELSKTLPVLMISDYILGSNVYSIMTDETEGAFKAVDHLIQLGHSSIAFINGNAEYTTYRYKHEGYKKALESNGIPYDTGKVINVDPHEEGGYTAGRQLLAMDPMPTAVFAASDQIVIGLYRSLQEQGKSIPEDISVFGFSNISISQQLYPPLSTVNQFPYYTGQLATQIFLKLCNKETIIQKRILLEPQLAIRSSCRAL